MITVGVRENVTALAVKLKKATEQGQLRFATAKALTKTAQQVQAETRAEMPKRFTLRRQWIVQGIRIVPATKQSLEAVIYSKDEAFMGRQEKGGEKRPKRDQNLAIPMRAVRRTKTAMIRKEDLPSSLGKAEFEVTRTNSRTGKTTSRKYRGAKGTVFKMQIKGKTYLCRRRPGKEVEVMYLLIPRAQIKERLGLHADAHKIMRERFQINLAEAFEYAMRTAR